MNFRKSTASAAFLLWALTMNPSGAPVSALVSPGLPPAAGSRKKSQLSASSFGAPPLVGEREELQRLQVVHRGLAVDEVGLGRLVREAVGATAWRTP